MKDEIYLTEQDFCARYHVCQRTARNWRTSGEHGPKWVRLGARRVGYRLSDCEAWAAARTFTSRAHEIVTNQAA